MTIGAIKNVKICGLSTPESVEAVIANGASHIGFIFFEKSPRHVSVAKAAELSRLAGDRIKTVAVTVNADNQYLDEIVARVKPDILQLHGSENPDRVQEVKSLYGLPVMKAFAIRDAADLEKTRPYEGLADLFLFDAKPPKGSDLPGGNGISFDWTLLRDFDSNTPYMLSGGLDADNVEEALERSGAQSVDISSGVEEAPGIKNIDAIRRFLLRLSASNTAASAMRV